MEKMLKEISEKVSELSQKWIDTEDKNELEKFELEYPFFESFDEIARSFSEWSSSVSYLTIKE